MITRLDIEERVREWGLRIAADLHRKVRQLWQRVQAHDPQLRPATAQGERRMAMPVTDWLLGPHQLRMRDPHVNPIDAERVLALKQALLAERIAR